MPKRNNRNIEIDNLKSASLLNEEDFDISEYLDNKLAQNARMTNQVKETLDRFEIKVEKTKEDLMKRIQQSLDNPLSN